ncbi:bomanin Bicipital 1 [Drosophila grimshawi]|uniref:GH21020 n=1 Tax=Drosophila grimshawi TaxID=7222 RepID=B4JRM3_DROGR|nr:bomanin Bicipital 1 [Drosophila grimshawi]EDV94413.1 GH21020 [Drosophila grimshawi]
MKYLTCALLLFGLLPMLISAYPSTVVVNGVCLTCPNPNGEPVYINGQEYRSFSGSGSGSNGNVVVTRPGYNNGRGTIIRRGGSTIVNGNCEICNVDV